MPNVGAVVDFDHSLVAGENPAEAAVLLVREGKLFQVHVNDNEKGGPEWLEQIFYLEG